MKLHPPVGPVVANHTASGADRQQHWPVTHKHTCLQADLQFSSDGTVGVLRDVAEDYCFCLSVFLGVLLAHSAEMFFTLWPGTSKAVNDGREGKKRCCTLKKVGEALRVGLGS